MYMQHFTFPNHAWRVIDLRADAAADVQVWARQR